MLICFNDFVTHRFLKLDLIISISGAIESLMEEGNILTCRDKKSFVSTLEILMECNPQDITEEKLKKWKKIGITKLSIGIQTFQEKFFKFLGRDAINRVSTAENNNVKMFLKNISTNTIPIETNNHLSLQNKIILAKQFFPNLSIDLIFGLPNQTLTNLKKDLKIIKELDLKHISWYGLDYKKNSRIENKKNKAIPYETVVKYYNFICKELEKQGFIQYEIYNWAKLLISKPISAKKCDLKPPFARGVGGFKSTNTSIHNLDFWNGKNYLGFGLSAVSTVCNTVIQNTRNLKDYLNYYSSNTLLPPGEGLGMRETLSKPEQNYLMLQRFFRLTKGASVSKIKKLVDENVFEKIIKSKFVGIKRNGLPQKISAKFSSQGRVGLTQQGKMYFNDFFEEIFST